MEIASLQLNVATSVNQHCYRIITDLILPKYISLQELLSFRGHVAWSCSSRGAALLAILSFGFHLAFASVVMTNSDFNLQNGVPFVFTWTDASGPVTIRLWNSTDVTAFTLVQVIASTQELPASLVD